MLSVYKLWHRILEDFPKKSKYSLGSKIDLLFIEVLEAMYTASYLSKKEKIPFLQRAINKLDTLKFFLQVAWEVDSLDETKFMSLFEPLYNIGQLLGGWRNKMIKENSPTK
ncbi:MAG: four helix bundle protein [bacterium]|nr:four helix bundle protein [bacterium]